MNDKDFEEMGKRLYDLEADPPQDGWNKIRPMIAPQQPAGKLVGLRKHWWKPLLLIIPATLYWLYPSDGLTPAAEVAPIMQSATIPTTEEKNTTENSAASEKPARDSQNETLAAIEGSISSESVEKIKNASDKNTITLNESKKISSAKDNNDTKNTLATSPTFTTTTTIAANTTRAQNATEVSLEKSDASGISRPTEQSSAMISPDSTIIKIKSQREENSTITSAKNDGTTSIIITTDQKNDQNKNVLPVEKLAAALAPASDSVVVNADSTLKEKVIPVDSIVRQPANQEEVKKDKGTWRMTAALIPQYETKTVKPLINDEVLVTNVNSTLQPQRIGFGLALGLGKSITPNFYIDGQLTFSTTEQNVNFSYSTGIVDTLIAVQQADQSVIVTPVFEVNNREISSRYNYGGLRLVGTYYFWSTPRRRFNFTAGAGAQYLLSARVKEKINNQWSSVGNQDLNKVNYSMIVSAGYNRSLSKGWEVMINPTLTYYLREVKNQSLPYNLNQRSFGMTVMVSKIIR